MVRSRRGTCNANIKFVLGWISCLALLIFAMPAFAQTAAPVWLEKKRPDPKGQPTKLNIAIYVLDITDIDDVKQTFSADLLAITRWQDKRLAHGSDESLRAALETVWHPRIVFLMHARLSAVSLRR